MRKALAPLLFEDDDPLGARAKRDTPVQKAEPSDGAKRKTASKTTPDGLPVQSMTDLLSHLGNLTLNEVHLHGQPDTRFILTTKPTELQAKAFTPRTPARAPCLQPADSVDGPNRQSPRQSHAL